MPLKLNSSGGGSVTLDVPTTASAFNLTIPATSGTLVTTASIPTPTGTLLNVQVFTSSGTYTRTSGATRAVVIAMGGGGGGGANSNGGTGGTTSFGSHVTAAGGSGGTTGSNGGGAGGTGGTGAIIAIRGQPGSAHVTDSSGGTLAFGNAGGQGGGQRGVAGVRGGGGGGNALGFDPCTGTGGWARGGGGQGEMAIDYISSGLGATETVTIGAGGTAGGGQIGVNAAAGGAGYIIVYEYS